MDRSRKQRRRFTATQATRPYAVRDDSKFGEKARFGHNEQVKRPS